jgi:hypothetical protein
MSDVTNACDELRPIWERTHDADGYVSIEVDPHFAGDIEATIAEATYFHEAIARLNLLVKIPATDAGVPAQSTCSSSTTVLGWTRRHWRARSRSAGRVDSVTAPRSAGTGLARSSSEVAQTAQDERVAAALTSRGIDCESISRLQQRRYEVLLCQMNAIV